MKKFIVCVLTFVLVFSTMIVPISAVETGAETKSNGPSEDTSAYYLARAGEAANAALGGYTATNATTASDIMSIVTSAISGSEAGGKVGADWQTGSFNLTPATEDKSGIITGTIQLLCFPKSTAVRVSIIIPALGGETVDPDEPEQPDNPDNPGEDVTEKIPAVKPLIETALSAVSVSNTTTKEELLKVVQDTIAKSDTPKITAAWSAFRSINATTEKTGVVYGEITLVYKNEKAVITYKGTIPVLKSYPIKEGADSKWEEGKNETVEIRVDGDFDKFTDVVIDGKIIDKSLYTVKTGSTIIVFTPEFLKTLPTKDYQVVVNFVDGEASTKLSIQSSAEPPKEDNSKIINGVNKTTVKAKSTAGKGYIRVSWTKSKGYKVDYYQVFRSTKKNTGYGTKAFFTTKNGETKSYKNTKQLKKGTRYYYKVRGVRVIDDNKVYTKWSTIANRSAK